MPSDTRRTSATGAFSALFTQYRSAVAATLEDVRAHLALRAGTDRPEQLRRELGPFAAGRIDADRLSVLLGETVQRSPAVIERLELAATTLRELAASGDGLMHLQVPADMDLTSAVRNRLAEIGGAFGAARLAASAIAETPSAPGEERPACTLPFAEWTAAERRLGPPLVVTIDGPRLHPAGLAEFLDGLQKIVLLVEGEAPLAPLVRLITPGVFVAQAPDASICGAVADWPGAAIAAIVPRSCALFTHDPSAGPELWQRLTVHQMSAPRARRCAGLSGAQQIEEVRQLEALAHRPVSAGVTPPHAPAGNHVDRVAAWLLRHADFREVAGGG